MKRGWSTEDYLWGQCGWGILMALGFLCGLFSDIGGPKVGGFGMFFIGAAAMQARARISAEERGWIIRSGKDIHHTEGNK